MVFDFLRRMNSKYILLFIILIFLGCIHKKDIKITKNKTLNKYERSRSFYYNNVKIDFPVDSTCLSSDVKYYYYAEIAALERKSIPSALKIIEKALKKYPKEFINSNLKQIFVVKSLSSKVNISGTVSGDTIYMSYNHYHSKSDPKYYRKYYQEYYNLTNEKRIHHEFSHILYNKYAAFFSKTKWSNVNELPYKEGGYMAIFSKNSKDWDTNFDYDLMLCGFLSPYAQSDIREDIASFAENIFCPTKDFWEIYNTYKKINEKKLLIIDFYKTLDSTFTNNYFHKMAMAQIKK